MTKASAYASLMTVSPAVFESLVFDIVCSLRFTNVQWRTPGVDGGRDIEARREVSDPTGYYSGEKWYIECKKYSNSVSWPTVYEKIAHADALSAKFLFIVTSSSASPVCLDRIETWNASHRSLKIRFWGGHDVVRFIETHPLIGVKHGILGSSGVSEIGDFGVAIEMAKSISSLYSSYQSKKSFDRVIDYSYWLSRLYSERMEQIKNFGKFTDVEKGVRLLDVPWIKSPVEKLELSADLVCVFSLLRYIIEIDEIVIVSYDDNYVLEISNNPTLMAALESSAMQTVRFLACVNFTGSTRLEIQRDRGTYE